MVKGVCVEIDGVFYESLKFAWKSLGCCQATIKKRCLSDKFPNYEFVPFRVTYTEKVCSKCGAVKQLSEFYRSLTKRDGLQSECKGCQSLYDGQYQEENAKELKKYREEYRTNHKKERAAWGRDYYQDNREEKLEKQKEYGGQREVMDRRNELTKKRRKTDVMFRLNTNMANAIRNSLKNGKNGAHWEGLVGYTCEELIAHLEKQFLPGMTRENYGKGEGFWEKDHHPIPLSWFVFEKPTDKGFRKAWALENLRPMWSGANQSKGNKLFHP